MTTAEDSSLGHSTPTVDPSQSSTPAMTGDSPSTSATTPPTSNPDTSIHTKPAPAVTAELPLTGQIRTPFAHPLPDCKPIQRPPLTPDQHQKYTTLLTTVRAWTTVPSTTTPKTAQPEPITDLERMWLTHECLLRYLRAVSWASADAAAKRLLTTLSWRREFDVLGIVNDPSRVAIESETGKQYILGYDIVGRPCLYMQPGRQNTAKSHRQIEQLVFMLESLVTMMDPGQDMTCLLISFKNATSGGSPSVAQGRQALGILQGHYPERLGRALISNLPWYISTFFKLISPFIDPVTRDKMIFNEDLRKYVPPSQLDVEVGGDAQFKYEHEVYWPELCRMLKERREAMWERWVSAGKLVGENEAYLRGGNVPSVGSEKEEKDETVEVNGAMKELKV
ncbi:MAG: hypothetical protein M1828_007598 [Chrysothrix sp. TS-e1954]|nr:MAG: hypothetical protein M1828_007598 [Chrysothrix sp. TS-e1954]